METYSLRYVAGGPDGLLNLKTSVWPLRANEVLVKITHSGVCGTDGHDRVTGCGLGHEGVGFVEKIGESFNSVKVGQRVGWGVTVNGWQTASCGHCKQCAAGYLTLCPEAQGQKYGAAEMGAFGDYILRHMGFVHSIPDAIESKHAAPLNCAGITVFCGLGAADTKSTDKVGVIGLGGLGHIAVMYARAMGCEVVVLSGSEDKRADAMALGATDFRVLSSPEDMKRPADINVMLLCGGSLSNLDFIFPLLAPRARIIPMVIQTGTLTFSYLPFILPNHRVISSTGGTREEHIAALEFAARHNIKPWVQEFPMSIDGLKSTFELLDIAARLSAHIWHAAIRQHEPAA